LGGLGLENTSECHTANIFAFFTTGDALTNARDGVVAMCERGDDVIYASADRYAVCRDVSNEVFVDGSVGAPGTLAPAGGSNAQSTGPGSASTLPKALVRDQMACTDGSEDGVHGIVAGAEGANAVADSTYVRANGSNAIADSTYARIRGINVVAHDSYICTSGAKPVAGSGSRQPDTDDRA
jgi:hypothetical protein